MALLILIVNLNTRWKGTHLRQVCRKKLWDAMWYLFQESLGDFKLSLMAFDMSVVGSQPSVKKQPGKESLLISSVLLKLRLNAIGELLLVS